MPRQDRIFYCYVYLNPLKPGRYSYGNFVTFFFEPFYIGKGKHNRLLKHLNDSWSVNHHKRNTIAKIKKQGALPIILKIVDKVFDKCAKCYEIYLITCIGRCDIQTGPLTNLTNGGEGLNGKQFTVEQKRLNSENRKLYFSNLENRKKTSMATKQGMQREEVKKKMEAAYKSPERSRKISETSKGRPVPEERKNKIRETVKALWQTQEYKDKMAAAMKPVYEDQSVRDKISLATKQAMNTPEMKAKMKLIYESPEQSKKLKLAWKNNPQRKINAINRMKGNQNSLGKTQSDESNLKRSLTLKGNKNAKRK